MVSKWVVTPIYPTYRLVEVPPGCGKLGWCRDGSGWINGDRISGVSYNLAINGIFLGVTTH